MTENGNERTNQIWRMNNGNRCSADGQRRLKMTASNRKRRCEYRWMK
jgi:hypothetical protein